MHTSKPCLHKKINKKKRGKSRGVAKRRMTCQVWCKKTFAQITAVTSPDRCTDKIRFRRFQQNLHVLVRLSQVQTLQSFAIGVAAAAAADADEGGTVVAPAVPTGAVAAATAAGVAGER